MQASSFSRRLWFLSFLLCHLMTTSYAYATEFDSSNPHLHSFLPRKVIVTEDPNNTRIIFDQSTNQVVPQGPATDGAGKDFSAPAVVWIIYCIVLGAPLALAGIRGWFFTTGAGVALAITVTAWAALINSFNQVGVPDLILTLIILGFSVISFVLGMCRFARLGGVAGMTLSGGVAFGIRLVLMKDGLLISPENLYPANWAIIVVCGIIGGLALAKSQRVAMLIGCASCGTFLLALAADLAINRQSGMSRGLRFLFDRNSNHLADILVNGYHPKLSTSIIIAASMGLTPILAYAQHRMFKDPFDRSILKFSDVESDLGKPEARTTLSGVWDSAKSKVAGSRFSM